MVAGSICVTERAAAVDRNLAAKLLQGSDLTFIFDEQSLHEEGRFNPRTIQIADKHADLEIKGEDSDFMQNWGKCEDGRTSDDDTMAATRGWRIGIN